MAELEQSEYNDNDLQGTMDIQAANEAHLACVLLLDTSSSMSGDPINSLNKAVNAFKEQTSMDELAKKRVDICIIEFNDTARVVQEFTPISQLEPVNLTARGCTSMGAGINLAIDKVKERNKMYASYGTPVYRPWIFMITDGEPTDDITSARERLIAEENKGTSGYGKLKFWAVGVPGYHRATITSLTKRCIELNGNGEKQFEGIFNWLSESMVTISVSNVNMDNQKLSDLPPGATPVPSDW